MADWSPLPPDSAPSLEFRWTDPITGEIAFMQTRELGFDDFCKTRMVVWADFLP